MLQAGTPHSPLTGVTWAKPNSIIDDSSTIPEHESSPNFFFPLKKRKADPEADVAASAGQEATLLRNRNPVVGTSPATKSTTLNVKGQAERAKLM